MPTEKEWNKIKWERQYNKDKSIAYFNSTNAAIEMTLGDKSISDVKDAKWSQILLEWRDFFIEEWKKWYLENMPEPEGTTFTEALESSPKSVKEKVLDHERAESINTPH